MILLMSYMTVYSSGAVWELISWIIDILTWSWAYLYLYRIDYYLHTDWLWPLCPRFIHTYLWDIGNTEKHQFWKKMRTLQNLWPWIVLVRWLWYEIEIWESIWVVSPPWVLSWSVVDLKVYKKVMWWLTSSLFHHHWIHCIIDFFLCLLSCTVFSYIFLCSYSYWDIML